MIVVFAGPTISESEVLSQLGCEVRPPVSHGDLIRLMADPPQAIGIVDGYFEGAPSVWHKEILYAMDQGVHVFGASSMGALRAAELDTFGMQGVGTIYEWYRDGVIEDDDEVAVQHGPAEVGFLVASEPMVSIRATLGAACDAGVIVGDQQSLLVEIAKGQFYKLRSWDGLIAAATGTVDASVLRRLESWLPENRIDLKKADAIAMLEVMRDRAESFATLFESSVRFEWTHVWDTAWRSLQVSGAAGLSELERRVLDEVRLYADVYVDLRRNAIAAWLAENTVDVEVTMDDARRALSAFRERAGLATREQLLVYLEENSLDEEALTRMMERRAMIEKMERAALDDWDRLCRLMLDDLKLHGAYERRVWGVQRKLKHNLYEKSAAGEWGIKRMKLLDWYQDWLGRGVGLDWETRHLQLVDIGSVAEFYTLIGTEYLLYQLPVEDMD